MQLPPGQSVAQAHPFNLQINSLAVKRHLPMMHNAESFFLLDLNAQFPVLKVCMV